MFKKYLKYKKKYFDLKIKYYTGGAPRNARMIKLHITKLSGGTVDIIELSDASTMKELIERIRVPADTCSFKLVYNEHIIYDLLQNINDYIVNLEKKLVDIFNENHLEYNIFIIINDSDIYQAYSQMFKNLEEFMDDKIIQPYPCNCLCDNGKIDQLKTLIIDKPFDDYYPIYCRGILLEMLLVACHKIKAEDSIISILKIHPFSYLYLSLNLNFLLNLNFPLSISPNLFSPDSINVKMKKAILYGFIYSSIAYRELWNDKLEDFSQLRSLVENILNDDDDDDDMINSMFEHFTNEDYLLNNDLDMINNLYQTLVLACSTESLKQKVENMWSNLLSVYNETV